MWGWEDFVGSGLSAIVIQARYLQVIWTSVDVSRLVLLLSKVDLATMVPV